MADDSPLFTSINGETIAYIDLKLLLADFSVRYSTFWDNYIGIILFTAYDKKYIILRIKT